MSVLAVTLCLLVGLLILWRLRSINKYWSEKGVKGPTPLLFFGNILPIITQRKTTIELLHEMYQQFPKESAVGFYAFTTPILLVRDVSIAEKVLVKNFSSFPDRPIVVDNKTDPLNCHLLTSSGDAWRLFRKKMSPWFHKRASERMAGSVLETALQMISIVSQTSLEKIALFPLAKMYVSDVINKTVFGTKAEVTTEFKDKCQNLLPVTFATVFKFWMMAVNPVVSRWLRVSFVSMSDAYYVLGYLKNYFQNQENLIFQPRPSETLINSMLALQESHNERILEPGQKITDNMMIGNVFGLIFAGSEASSLAITMNIYELAANQEVQQRLRQELRATYGEVSKPLDKSRLDGLNVMEGFIKECLRVHNIAPILGRRCAKELHLSEMNYTIRKGENVVVFAQGIHLDEKHYKNPEKIDPDRWINDRRLSSKVFMPFGHGPRVCIAAKLAILEIKAMLCVILDKYSCVKLNKLTQLPLKFNASSVMKFPKNDVYVDFVP